ncbi:MAG: hypothetical protein KDH96_12365, partial [Candidatus Riesia sp.]|nr:hypothetical protein [Candidatus Riesia sp.]
MANRNSTTTFLKTNPVHEIVHDFEKNPQKYTSAYDIKTYNKLIMDATDAAFNEINEITRSNYAMIFDAAQKNSINDGSAPLMTPKLFIVHDENKDSQDNCGSASDEKKDMSEIRRDFYRDVSRYTNIMDKCRRIPSTKILSPYMANFTGTYILL